MVVATERRVHLVRRGRPWRPRDTTRSEQLAWGAPDALYRADPGGLIKVSADGGASWKDGGRPAPPSTSSRSDADGALYAGVPGGKVVRSTDGGARWKQFVVLR